MKRRLVDFTRNDDFNCAMYGAFGFSTNFIQRKTGLEPGRVVYRLKKANIRRMDFRNGESPFAQLVIRQVRDIAEPKLHDYLRKHVPAPAINMKAHTSARGSHPWPLKAA